MEVVLVGAGRGDHGDVPTANLSQQQKTNKKTTIFSLLKRHCHACSCGSVSHDVSTLKSYGRQFGNTLEILLYNP